LGGGPAVLDGVITLRDCVVQDSHRVFNNLAGIDKNEYAFVERCWFTGSSDTGFAVGAYTVFRNNVIDGMEGYYAIDADAANNHIYVYNNIFVNQASGTGGGDRNGVSGDPTAGQSNVEWANNIVIANQSTSPLLYGFNVHPQYRSNNCVIGNFFTNFLGGTSTGSIELTYADALNQFNDLPGALNATSVDELTGYRLASGSLLVDAGASGTFIGIPDDFANKSRDNLHSDFLNFTSVTTSSLWFNGSDVAIGVPHSGLSSLTTFSISAWVRLYDRAKIGGSNILHLGHITGDYHALQITQAHNGSFKDVGGTDDTLAFRADFSTTSGWWYADNGILSFNQQAGGRWDHVAVTYDGTDAANQPTFYLNGQLLTTNVKTAPVGTLTALTYLTATIGNTNLYTDFWKARDVHGNMCDIALFTDVLNANDIANIYGAGYPGDLSTLTTTPSNWWPLTIENVDLDTNIVNDIIGTANGILSGTFTDNEGLFTSHPQIRMDLGPFMQFLIEPPRQIPRITRHRYLLNQRNPYSGQYTRIYPTIRRI